VERLNDGIFAEVTYHAAYEPQRAVRTERWKYIRRFDEYPHPVLANCDDSASKSVLVEAGWGEVIVAREQLYDLVLDPAEGSNLVADAPSQEVLPQRNRGEGADPVLVEDDTAGGQPIQRRGTDKGVAVGAKVVLPQGVADNNQDIPRWCGCQPCPSKSLYPVRRP
jgi:hypothetical protein